MPSAITNSQVSVRMDDTEAGHPGDNDNDDSDDEEIEEVLEIAEIESDTDARPTASASTSIVSETSFCISLRLLVYACYIMN